MKNNRKKIILTGGGTGGSVSPLLAIYETVINTSRKNEFDFLWVGGLSGPEKEMVNFLNIPYRPIPSGKFRRYFSWKNFVDIFGIFFGFLRSLFIIMFERPDLIIAAGSFISVPFVWAGWIYRVPIIIHQQDVKTGLANKLMAPFASVITKSLDVPFEKYERKTRLIGTPLREEVLNNVFDVQKFKEIFGLEGSKPVLLVIGGGTGALALNKLIEDNLDNLIEKFQLIHVVGKHKSNENILPRRGYYKYEFLDVKQLSAFYRIADIVITRCGMGVLSEISYMGKSAILVPLPDSHQEDNAKYFFDRKAAIVLDQSEINSGILNKTLENLIADEDKKNELVSNIKTIMPDDANGKMLEIIISMLKK